MTDYQTPNLSLPYIAPQQAQKHVTHNEAIRRLDVLVQLRISGEPRDAPPQSPQDGECHRVGPNPIGDWAGRAGLVAAWQDGAWDFHAPQPGWIAGRADGEGILVFDGTDWRAGAAGPFPRLGVNAEADADNRFVVASPASLFTHEGADHRIAVNRADAGDTASLVFQTDHVGTAEFGLTGDRHLRLKVSPDGTAWFDAMVIDPESGAVGFPRSDPAEIGGSGTAARIDAAATADGSETILADLDLSAVDSDAPPYRMVYSGHHWQNAGAGRDYWDHTLQLGWNMAAGGGRVDENYPSFGVQWESRFTQGEGQPFGWEWHVRGIDRTGAERRPISIFGVWDEPQSPKAGITFEGNFFHFETWDERPILHFDTAEQTWFSEYPVYFKQAGKPVQQQMNAAGTAFLPLPYYNGANTLVAGPAWFSNAGDPTVKAYLFVSAANVPADYSMLYLSQAGPSCPGNMYALRLQGTADGTMNSYIRQAGTTASSHNVFELAVASASGGDPNTRYTIGSTSWTVGLDNSDGDAFKIGRGFRVGAEDHVVLKEAVSEFRRPVRPPRLTLATLPVLSAADDGAIAYVGDGPSGKTLAVWDGANWRSAATLGAIIA